MKRYSTYIRASKYKNSVDLVNDMLESSENIVDLLESSDVDDSIKDAYQKVHNIIQNIVSDTESTFSKVYK